MAPDLRERLHAAPELLFLCSGNMIRSAFAQLLAHWLRSSLTLTGIVLGVFSINAMFSLVGGVRDGLDSLFDTIALDGMVFVSPRRIPTEERDAFTSASLGIQPADADAINAAIPGVIAVPRADQIAPRAAERPAGKSTRPRSMTSKSTEMALPPR